jgi:hypothetical protein
MDSQLHPTCLYSNGIKHLLLIVRTLGCLPGYPRVIGCTFLQVVERKGQITRRGRSPLLIAFMGDTNNFRVTHHPRSTSDKPV